MANRPSTGFVVGKFYPPHRGHKYLIDSATAGVDRLTVMLVWRPGEMPTGEERLAWLREIHPNVEFLSVEDTVLDNDDSAAWADYVRSMLGYVPDVVFTSEDYGVPFSRCLGSRHVSVDRARSAFPCSGTAIRANPLANWDCLEPCVRAYYVKRVCVVGAESTGTTTMAEALAAHYKTVWVPEYGRAYCETKFDGLDLATNSTVHEALPHYWGREPERPGATTEPQPTVEWKSEEFTQIARMQCAWEDEAARKANRVLICDTAAFATSVWHERYLGTTSTAVDAIAKGRRYDLILLTDVDIPFVQDGLRDGEHIRHAMHQRFVEVLSTQSVAWHLLSGPHEGRLHLAISLVDALLGRQSH